MNMPLLSIKIQHPSFWKQTVTVDFPGLTAFYNRQEGTPASRICAVIFGDFAGFVTRFGGGSGDLADAVALYTALELFDEDPMYFSHPIRAMNRATNALTAMISFKRWRVSEEKGKLLGLERELSLLAPYHVKQN
ncbi:hypothetical protein [Puia dinghuensis]|uniref:Uncharacterized protein n=1 Tax=Puia dinghuensis TaxID=1792502 RepID=A0A8J2XRQ8_9BACT|nr:hypothetical protein [Puia dinghuensis]GGA90104.1 hypothetical protein GCM10011511_11670 [Puia dinghuensis]